MASAVELRFELRNNDARGLMFELMLMSVIVLERSPCEQNISCNYEYFDKELMTL